MNSTINQYAGKAALALSGLTGTKMLLPLDVDKIVTTANMKVGAYSLAAQPLVPCRITLTHTVVETVDTLGTVVILGTLPDTTVVQETLIPVADTEVSTVNEFATITSVTGAGWVIDAGVGTADTITVGTGAIVPESYHFEAITDRIVASADMKVGTFTIAAQPYVPSKITLTHTLTSTVDTLGTVTISGNDVDGRTITDTLTPVSSSTVTTTNVYKDVVSVTGADWVVAAGADTIVVGTAEVSTDAGYFISGINVVAAAVVASQTTQTDYTVADLTNITSIPVGFYPTRSTSIELTSGEAIAYLSRL